MRPLSVFCLSSAACALLLVGCTGASVDPNRPKTVPVTGTVTYNGSPVAGANVAFVTDSPQGRGAIGVTDEAGKYSLLTFAPGDGAIPGIYRVTVSKVESLGGGEISEAPVMAEGGVALDAAAAPKDLLPEKYKSPETSELTAEVKEGGENTFDFQLSD